MNRIKFKSRKRLILITIVLCIVFTVLIGEGLLHAPLWIYQIQNDNAPAVNNTSNSIVAYSELSTETIISNIHGNDIDGIMRLVDIHNLRETPKGYYAIIQASDNRKIICFFGYSMMLKNYVVVKYGFLERKQAEFEIQELLWNSRTNEYETSLPYQELNTGAEYLAFYYRDGIDIVLYGVENDGIKMPDKENYLCTATKIHSLSYSDLFLNPKYWFDPNNELGYILKKDRTAFGDVKDAE